MNKCEECDLELSPYDNGEGIQGYSCDGCGFSWDTTTVEHSQPSLTIEEKYQNALRLLTRYHFFFGDGDFDFIKEVDELLVNEGII